MADDWDITTGDGSVTLYLPPNFNADLDARTNDGGIRNELQVDGPKAQAEAEPDAAGQHPAVTEPSLKSYSKNTLRGQLGTGGHVLKIRTGDGSIRLRAN